MTAERPLVSLIVANRDGARHLPAAIASAQAQTLRAWEMIVVDDASSDESVALVAQAASDDPRIRLVPLRAQLGPGGARNHALKTARGRFIAIFDADDLMASERLARLVDRAEADCADIVADNLIAFTGAPEAGCPFLPERAFAKPRWVDLAEVIATSRMYARRPGFGYLKPLIRAAALRTSGVRYDEILRIGEDYEFLTRLLAKGLRLRLEPAALYFYRRHPASVSHRLERTHLQAMLAADAAFAESAPSLPPAARRALRARRRSLERALAYDEVIRRLKGGDVAGGLARGLADPALWPLLTLPVTARLKRLAGRTQPQPA